MSDLLVIVFPKRGKAEQGSGELLSMEKQDLITMEDAVFAVKNADGSVKLNQLVTPSAFWEIRAAASGNPGPTGAGALTDFGTNETFVKNLADALSHGSAAVFVLVSKKAADGILERL